MPAPVFGLDGKRILVLGGGSASGATSTTQKTLTVVIKFGPDQRVDTFSYHASRF